jgi:hypothetical protein
MKVTKIAVIICLILSSCKNHNSDIKNINVKEETAIVDQQNYKKFFDSYIGRFEFNISENGGALYGDFYSPSTDSLLIFSFVPKNEISKNVCTEISKKAGDEYEDKQRLLAKNIDHFDVKGFHVDYKFVMEQKNAGGDDVFNIKEPLKAQSLSYINGKIVKGKTKTYQTFEEIYQ